MKFLIIFGKTNLAEKLHPSRFSSEDFGVHCSDAFSTQVRNTYVLCSQRPSNYKTPDDKIILWDGAPINQDVAFSSRMHVPDAPDRISQYIETVVAGRAPEKAAGIFGCAQISANGTCIIMPDPLSQYSFFSLTNGNQHFFSNSLHLIEKACKLLGVSISRDFACTAFEAAFGIGGWTRTGLAGVNKIPPNHFVVYQQENLNFVPFKSSVFLNRPNSQQYEQKARLASESLKNSAIALSKSFPEQGLVLDLSGGKDTRLLLGAQMTAESGNFHVFLGGTTGGADQQAASRLVEHYNLDSVQFLSTIGSEERILAIDTARRAAYRFMGTSSLYQSDLGESHLTGVAQVRGGSSEARTRSFFRLPRGKKRRKALAYDRRINSDSQFSLFEYLFKFRIDKAKREKEQLVAALISRGRPKHHLFRREFIKDAHQSITKNIEWLAENNVARENLADAFYIFDRGWRHCGFPVQVMNDSKTVFEPLNDITVLEAHFALQENERTSARVAFDLFELFDQKDLLEMPFADSSWPETRFSNPQRLRRQELSRISAQKKPARSILGPAGFIENRQTLGNVNYMRAVQPFMLDIVSGIPTHHSCWDYLHRERFIQNLSSGALATDRFASFGTQLLQAFIWITNEESRIPVA